MASVTIDRAPICSDPADEVPKRWWPVLIDERRQFCKHRLPADCRMLSYFIEDGEKADWVGYGSREAYLSDGLQLDPEIARLAIEGLKFCDPEKATKLKRAVVLGKHGGDRKSAGRDQGANGTLKRGSNSKEYTLARLDRDGHAALAAAVRAGAMSAKSARRQAGFPEERKRHCPHCGGEL